MDRAPRIEVEQSATQPPDSKPQMSVSDALKLHVPETKTHQYKSRGDRGSISSTHTSWSFLQRKASQRSDEKPRGLGPSLVAKAWEGRSERARQRAEERRREDLKKSIHLVGQVDPRAVETTEDTSRRLAFQTRKESFGHDWVG
jgi:hypothetical protein